MYIVWDGHKLVQHYFVLPCCRALLVALFSPRHAWAAMMHDSDMMPILALERHLGTVFVQYIFEMHECSDWPKKSTLTTTTTTDRDFFAGFIFFLKIFQK